MCLFLCLLYHLSHSFTLFFSLQAYADAFAQLPPGARGRVLIVDDENTSRTVLAKMIEKLGFECVAAENGKEGFRRYCDHAGKSTDKQ